MGVLSPVVAGPETRPNRETTVDLYGFSRLATTRPGQLCRKQPAAA